MSKPVDHEYFISGINDLDRIGDEEQLSGSKCIMTIRIPRELHAKLHDQARENKTSLNLLCISRLLAHIHNCPVISTRTVAAKTK